MYVAPNAEPVSAAPVSPSPLAEPEDRDRQHLELLAIFHFILAGFVALFSCLFLIHFGLGIAITTGQLAGNTGDVPPPFVGWLLTGLGGFAVLAGWTYAGCLVAAGRFLRGARRHTFCVVVAGLACLIMPLGTVLGVFSILVLIRPSVQQRFVS